MQYIGFLRNKTLDISATLPRWQENHHILKLHWRNLGSFSSQRAHGADWQSQSKLSIPVDERARLAIIYGLEV